MGVRTVTLSEDAYAVLASRKKTGESFSDVVRRLAATQRSLTEFIGVWKDFPRDKMREFEKWLEWSDRHSREELLRVESRPRKGTRG